MDTLIDLRILDSNKDAKEMRVLTEDEMMSLVVEFLGAAESIVSCVGWTLAHLISCPELQRKLRNELTGDSYMSDELLGRCRIFTPLYSRASGCTCHSRKPYMTTALRVR